MTAHSILARLDPAAIATEPFPHLVAENALDPGYYAELAAAFPDATTVAGPGELASNRAYRLPAPKALAHPDVPPLWREFVEYHCSDAYLRELVRFWGPAIARAYPDFERLVGKPLPELTGAMRRYSRRAELDPANLGADVALDCQFVINSPVRERSSVRGPHLDQPYTLFAALLYFRDPSDRSEGGDLELYRRRGAGGRFDGRYHVAPEAVEAFRTVRYAPNTLVMWLNTRDALHGVTPRAVTEAPRAYVNFVADCYGLAGDVLFEVPRTPAAAVKGWARHALRERFLRRARRGAA
jgi:hypothetical protein